MSRLEKLPRFAWRLFHFLPPRLAYSLGLGSMVGGFVLLLHTTGRKSGRRRTTPLLYDEIEGVYYIATARGRKADWYRNAVATPKVEVEIGSRRFEGLAEAITDEGRVLHFLERRLALRPRVVGLFLWLAGIGSAPSRQDLERYAQSRGLMAIRPLARTQGQAA